MSPVTEPPKKVAFQRPDRAQKDWQRVAGLLSEAELKHLPSLLRQSPDPDGALSRLERFLDLGEPAHDALRGSGRRLNAALAIFSHSNFLSDALQKRPELLGWALESSRFHRVLRAEEMRSDLAWIDPAMGDDKAALVLARFRRMQLLRIALRDLLGVADLPEVALELSNLADAILEGAHDHIREQLIRRFGRPLVHTGDAHIEGRFVVLALGKHGGRELNYSSDIDLMYLHTGDGQTAGPIKTSNQDLYQQLATRLTKMLSVMTAEGFAYRVDLRLRPEGSAGDLVTSLDSAVTYYNSRARDWELQMLIKARPAAGDLRLGAALLQMVRPLIYKTTTDFSVIEKVAEGRDRIQKNRRRGGAEPAVDVKLERGGIRDIEFLVQCLQRLHGGQDPFVRSGGTLFALHRLHEKNHISSSDYSALNAAYQYLRTCEHRLQMLDDRQTHELPKDDAQLRLLERRLSGVSYSSSTPADLEQQLQTHFRQVIEIYDRVIRAQGPDEDEAEERFEAPAPDDASTDSDIELTWRPQLRQIAASRPRLAALLEALTIRRGARTFAGFLEAIVAEPETLDRLEASPGLVDCVGDLIENSPYLGNHLLRHADDLSVLEQLAAGCAQGGSEDDPPDMAGLTGREEAAPLFDDSVSYTEKSMTLRRIYRRRMFEVLTDSIHNGRPIFTTLALTSDLGEWVVREAYRLAVAEALKESGRETAPEPGLLVIALGRLGMREFDLGSDADLVFAAPEADEEAMRFWRLVVKKIIEIISSYTAEGRIFSIDARLRPNGRDGALVQTTAAFEAYFAKHAEAWEALSYMKARTVAGDLDMGRRFLRQLQEVGWKRFGQDADLAKLLRDMRDKLEREQGRKTPLKAGAGGYYDIDFILLYLRLRDGGFFYDYLSTPRRIEICLEHGGLTEKQADFLRGAAVFFRSLDHAVRTATGESSSDLPTSPALYETVTELLARWSVIRPDAQPLAAVAEETRRGVRALFRELF